MNINAFNHVVFRETGIHKKIILVMKMTSFLLLVLLMQVSAAGLAQKINLNEKNVSLKSVIEKVRLQSGYNFLYVENVLAEAQPVNIQIQNIEFADALKRIFSNQALDYEIKGKTVVIRKKESSFIEQIKTYFKTIDVTGKITDENGNPLANASVRIKGTNIVVYTDKNGAFILKNVDEKATLTISFVGYDTLEWPAGENIGIVRMTINEGTLEEVGIVSTGYQKLPKERATGSFENINRQLFNRSTGTDVISRLNGVSLATKLGGYSPPSGQLNHRTNPLVQYSVRGLSTLSPYGNDRKPLIVIDNFPYDGDINNINPNDVENVTVLKDAAALSIWGTRAGNGVIVISTKRGAFNKPFSVELNSNVTIGDKPDLVYVSQINTSDLIDYQTFLYQKGRFTSSIANQYAFIPEVIDLLDRQSKDPTNPVYQQRIDEMRNSDIRNDQLKYFYRTSVNQQYAINVNGGSNQMNYYLSGGYDKNLENSVTNGYNRLNLKMNSLWKPLKNLEVETGILFTKNKYTETAGSNNYLSSYSALPYVRLADKQGHPVAVYPSAVRKAYLDTAGNGRLLDWSFKPLEEIFRTPRIFNNQDVLLNMGITYKLNPIFSASVKYQFEKNKEEENINYNSNSFYARDLINTYSQYSYIDKTIPATRPIPTGDIIQNNFRDLTSNVIRGQLNADKIWNNYHALHAITGVEIREIHTESFSSGNIFGYKSDPITIAPVNSIQQFPLYNDENWWGTALIPQSGVTLGNLTNRYTSLYLNASYSYKTRYIVSGSARKDASNIFGATPNRRGTPLWSAGLGWIVSDESFFKSSILNYLKLRATYGYQGNVNNNYSAYPIIEYRNDLSPINSLQFATTTNPPNPNLGWEKIGMLNFGADFSAFNSHISGSLEYYEKYASNLIAPAPVAANTGFTTLDVNSANLHGKGIELSLNTKNLSYGQFKWVSDILFSYNRTVVNKYFVPNTRAVNFVMRPGGIPNTGAFIVGDDAYNLYTYKFAGLNPQTGAPRGYLNGLISEDYVAISNADVKELDNRGSISPHYFGSFRNTFTWKNIALSANILYKFGYVFGRNGLNYSALSGGGSSTADYSKRWEKPGDEAWTNIPAAVYPTDFNASSFYLSSAALVEPGDHIRLQDINISYAIPGKMNLFKSLKLYANMNNIGILWRKNKLRLDPDAGNFAPAPRTFAFGFNANF